MQDGEAAVFQWDKVYWEEKTEIYTEAHLSEYDVKTSGGTVIIMGINNLIFNSI